MILITGGAGYVGSALLPLLDERGHDIRVLDDFSASNPRNLTGIPAARYEFIRGDVRDRETVERAVTDVDSIIHLAGRTGAAASHERRAEVFDVNASGTQQLVGAASDAGVERILLASTCNVYGDAYAREISEESEASPPNPYAESKLRAETACRSSEVDTVILRLATNFGWSPGVRFNLVVNSFVFRALVGDPLTVYGDGRNWRPFLHVRDTARAFASALDWEPGTYNVGDDNYRIEEVAQRVEDAVRESVDITYLADADPGPSYHVDFTRMHAQGFEPRYGLEAGIADLAEQFT